MSSLALRRMSLLRAGSLRPILDLPFSTGDPAWLREQFTHTRATIGKYHDSTGVLQDAASGVARVESHVFDGVDWIRRGLLPEEARTWHALWNRDFTNAAWVKLNMGTAKDATGLDAVANSATTLTATAANATALQTVTISSAAFTYSIYVKRVTGTGDIDITDNNGTNWTTLTGLSSTLWTRHDITRTQANPVFGVRIVTDTDAVEVDFAGLEPGGIRTSPIATTTAAVARAADVLTKNTSDFPFNESEGTILIEAMTGVGLANSQVLLLIHEDNDGRGHEFASLVSGTQKKSYRVGHADDGYVATHNSGATLAANQAFSIVGAYKINDFAMSSDGAAVQVDTGGAVPNTIQEIRFGQRTNDRWWNGHIARVTIWNRRLPNTTLEVLSA